MKRIGQHIYSREARLKPAELYCVNLIQETYRCDECINSNGSEVLISSEMPQSLLPHSYFSSTILAKVAELKFNLALPFHRQIKLWQKPSAYKLMPDYWQRTSLKLVKLTLNHCMIIYKD